MLEGHLSLHLEVICSIKARGLKYPINNIVHRECVRIVGQLEHPSPQSTAKMSTESNDESSLDPVCATPPTPAYTEDDLHRLTEYLISMRSEDELKQIYGLVLKDLNLDDPEAMIEYAKKEKAMEENAKKEKAMEVDVKKENAMEGGVKEENAMEEKAIGQKIMIIGLSVK